MNRSQQPPSNTFIKRGRSDGRLRVKDDLDSPLINTDYHNKLIQIKGIIKSRKRN